VLYLSYQQNTWPFMTLVVAPAATPAAAVAAVRQESGASRCSQAIGAVHMLDELRTEWLAQPRVQTTIVTLFGVATLLLTLVGLVCTRRAQRGSSAHASSRSARRSVRVRPMSCAR